MDMLLRQAIAGKRLIACDYEGLPRVAEPHVYGTLDGKSAVLTYQVGGQSRSGGIPNWRRLDLEGISNLSVLTQTFVGPRPYPSGKHSSFDVIHAVVR
jgi:hypothetical protein